MADPARVHVLVDLAQRPAAGGHVKCWERMADAATGLDDELDLTVHFSGGDEGTRALAANVRFKTHRPVFSSSRLPFLTDVPDHTDLAHFHPRLARSLEDADVLHTTDAFFAFARTAERVARRRALPLVTSIHTDTPRYTSVFARATIERLFGTGRLGRLLEEGAALPRRAEARMRERLAAHQRRCAAVVVSRPDELAPLARALSPERVSLLRRGIDRAVFRAVPGDRPWLERTFDVPPGRVVVLIVGRLDRGKNIAAAVEAVRALTDEGLPLHLLCVGEGPDWEAVLARLGGRASCPGQLPPTELARAYASVDVVVHPSLIEVCSNVVLEALACGRPLLVSGESGNGRHVIDGMTGIVVEGTGVEPWARALRRLAEDAALRVGLGAAAARWAATAVPSWRDVLREDLVPVWRHARASKAMASAAEARVP